MIDEAANRVHREGEPGFGRRALRSANVVREETQYDAKQPIAVRLRGNKPVPKDDIATHVRRDDLLGILA
ncbi:hypothetical protein [Georgenia sp. AZ-5]|uniref:hypothetical protein n=1 Tax=Georgenia sp. AZ-5 TaxID=3367526 RepID=UPI003754D09F